MRISVAQDGSQAVGPNRGQFYDYCCSAEITPNRRYVAFSSRATNLVPHDSNHTSDVFVKDLRTGNVDRVSVASDGTEGHGVCVFKRRQQLEENPEMVRVAHGSGSPSISDNGRYVAFTSCATNLVHDDRNLATDVFVHDRKTDRTRRVSISSSGEETPPDVSVPGIVRVSRNGGGQINSTGTYVAFYSSAGNLVPNDTNEAADVFVRDLKRGRTQRVSVSSEGQEGVADGVGGGWDPDISASGRYVAFASVLRGLVPGDTNKAADVFVRDRLRHRTQRVSVASDGAQAELTGVVVGLSAFPHVPAIVGNAHISRNGRFVGFDNLAANLVPADQNRGYDAFVHDRATRRTSRISVDSEGQEFTAEPDEYVWSVPVSMSGDAGYTTFVSWRLARHEDSDDLFCRIPLQCYRDIYRHFIHDSKTGETELLSDPRRPARALAGDTSDGRSIVFVSRAANFVKGDTNGIEDVFLHDRGGRVSAVAIHRGSTARTSPLGAADTPRVTSARLLERPHSRDFFGVLELDSMRSTFLAFPGVSVAYSPGAAYTMAFTVGARKYEVRIGTSARSATSLGLYQCSSSAGAGCRKVADLKGGYGTTGEAIVFAVPFELVRFAGREEPINVRVFYGYGTSETGVIGGRKSLPLSETPRPGSPPYTFETGVAKVIDRVKLK